MRRRRIFATAGTSLAVTMLLLVGSCRPLGRRPPPGGPAPDALPVETAGPPAPPVRDSVPASIAAIIDSIETVVRDSIEAAAREANAAAAAARRDSAAAVVRRDSIQAAARDSIAAAARRDSIASAARRDSIAAAVRDSAAASALRDSIAEAARLDSIARVLAPVTEELAELRALGPSYIPYDRGPRPVWDTEMQAKVTTTLLPVIRAEELVARTRAYFWLLVRADGTVDEVVLQTSSGSSAFDEAAARVARALLFAPAIRGQRAVPTWVVRDVSLIMQ